MAVLRAEEFENFIKRKASTMNGLLFHGSDAEAVSSLARQTIRAIAGEAGAGAATLHVELSSLKENPGRIIDEFQSLSLLGDRRIIAIDGVDENTLKFLEPVLQATFVGNFVVLQAGNLSKTSKLRVACEQAALIASLVIYEEDQAAIATRIRRLLSEAKLQWQDDAEALFFATVGMERSTVNQEIAKLILYCHGQAHVAEEDVTAICGDTAAFGVDELIDAVFAGNLEKTDRMASNFDGDQRMILTGLMSHLTRLQALRGEMECGMNADAAVRAAKPPIFFKRQTAVKNQLRTFELTELLALQQSVASAIFQTRKVSDLGDAVTNRTLLSIARTAAAKLK
jgi:DNA polymerase III subunit delta